MKLTLTPVTDNLERPTQATRDVGRSGLDELSEGLHGVESIGRILVEFPLRLLQTLLIQGTHVRVVVRGHRASGGVV